ncbi:hypothetical protein [Clostridium gelidum]|nr:hypothetical protein [Clostridium gelidum]
MGKIIRYNKKTIEKLCGGFSIDAYLSDITRKHKDIERWRKK